MIEIKRVPTPGDDGWSLSKLLETLMAMVREEDEMGSTGPWVVALGPNWTEYLAHRYSLPGKKYLTLAGRIVENSRFLAVTVSDKMSGWDVALYGLNLLYTEQPPEPKPKKRRPLR